VGPRHAAGAVSVDQFGGRPLDGEVLLEAAARLPEVDGGAEVRARVGEAPSAEVRLATAPEGGSVARVISTSRAMRSRNRASLGSI
jgi:hypothetical protein